MERKLLILGLDPGTTLAYALIDLNGNIIKVSSTKQHSLSSVLSEIIEYGKIVAVAADKHKSPGFVAKIASSLGARLLLPKSDLTQEEKREIVSDKDKNFENVHQKDALAAALHAYSEIKPRLQKINMLIETYEKGKIVNRIKETLIKDEYQNAHHVLEKLNTEEEFKSGGNLNISSNHPAHLNFSSVSNNTALDKKSNSPIVQKTPEQKLKEKLKHQSNEITLLRQHISNLKQKNLSLELEIKKLEKKQTLLSSQPSSKLAMQNGADKNNKTSPLTSSDSKNPLYFKDQKITSLNTDIQRKNQHINSLNSKLDKLQNLILFSGSGTLVKKIKNLSYEEVSSKIRQLKIQNEECILVENISIISENSLSLLKGRVNFLITGQKNRYLSEHFLLLPKQDIQSIFDTEDFAILDTQKLTKAKSSTGIFEKVLNDYLQEREL